MARELGYVTTVCGRKRRLPDLQLDEFEFEWKGNNPYDDVLDFDNISDNYVPDSIANKYLKQLYSSKFSDRQKIIDKADKDGIIIHNNGKKIADSTRQCVNSRIQGSASDLTKLAMVKLVNSAELKQLGFKLLIQVHDEVIAECPKVNAKRCSELLADLMSQAAEEILKMPIKTDVEITEVWYGERVEV